MAHKQVDHHVVLQSILTDSTSTGNHERGLAALNTHTPRTPYLAASGFGHNNMLLTTFTFTHDVSCVHEQKAAANMYWAWSRGVATIANKNTLFVTFVSRVTGFEAQ